MSRTDRPQTTLLVIDHRQSMALGEPGETVLDYCRPLAREQVADSRRESEPLGLLTVGDNGMTGWDAPTVAKSQYSVIDNQLEQLKPTQPGGDEEGTRSIAARPISRLRHSAGRLERDGTAFDRIIRSYISEPMESTDRFAADPLHRAIKHAVGRVSNEHEFVFFTDDSYPGELRASIDLARRHGHSVTVHIAPRALFEPRGLAEAETTYRLYREYERFQSELENRTGVEAHRIAPA